MDERVVKFRVGVMVLATLIIVGILILLFGGTTSLVKQQYFVKIKFPQAPGVTQDTPVRKSGILIGRVNKVEFDEDGGVIVTIGINADVKLKRSEICRISGSLLGDATLEFVPGPDHDKPAEFIQNGDFLTGTVTTNPLQTLGNLEGGLTKAIGTFSTAGTEVTRLARHLDDLLGNNDENINRIVQKSERTLDDFQVALANVNSLFGDEKMRSELHSSISELPKILRDTREAMNGMKSTVSLAEKNLRNLEGFTEPLGQRGGALVDNLDSSVSRLDELLEQLVQFSKAVNQREGTIGQLVNNPDLYQHLNAAACNIEQLTRELKPIVKDARVFTDKIARHPETLGVRGAIKKNSGIK
jgi:phospholipid/cholesterol/gamma-HCH transport system substrate-binding protein